ncbi:hypothetical protein [Humisphaera borealis]|uniref:Uncharacterized protein n=1 Tax=Humisphaera borealis TaxID=2807512 RepID=A0A7M2X0A9_9BACT|nr:hypothetical protein [Humisphaera borealis]QOV91089.1 hypothetical protein IPV69_06950 [Humisphaera borealis]
MRFAAILSITLLAIAGCNKPIHEASSHKAPALTPVVGSASSPQPSDAG